MHDSQQPLVGHTQPAAQGMYDPTNEHDACGVGFVAHIKGKKSHEIVLQGLKILENIDHRGAVGADSLMGDGAGILIQIPDAFYREEMAKQGVTLPPAGEYGVGMIFLPKEHASRLACEQELERTVNAEGQVVLGWRDVPVDIRDAKRCRQRDILVARPCAAGRARLHGEHDAELVTGVRFTGEPDAVVEGAFVVERVARREVEVALQRNLIAALP